MADNPTFSNRTYAGEFFGEMFAPTVLDPAGLEDHQLATVIDRFKFKETIYESDDTVVLQDPSPLFQEQGTQADTDEVNLELTAYDFGKEISLDDIRKSWYSGDLQAGSLNDYTHDQLIDMYVSEVYVPKLKMAQDHLVLQGKTGLAADIGTISFAGAYTGLYPALLGSSDVKQLSLTSDEISIVTVTKGTTTALNVTADVNDFLQVGNMISIRSAAGTGWTALNGDWEVTSINSAGTIITIALDSSALTSADYTGNTGKIRYINMNNIIQKMAVHLRSTPAKVRRGGANKIAIPEHLLLEWQFAVSEAQQNGGQYYLTSHQMKMISEQLVVLDNAPANTIGTWDKKRVFYGYDLSSDYSTVEVLWQGNTTGDKVYRLQGKMKTGITISTKFAHEITLTTPG